MAQGGQVAIRRSCLVANLCLRKKKKTSQGQKGQPAYIGPLGVETNKFPGGEGVAIKTRTLHVAFGSTLCWAFLLISERAISDLKKNIGEYNSDKVAWRYS